MFNKGRWTLNSPYHSSNSARTRASTISIDVAVAFLQLAPDKSHNHNDEGYEEEGNTTADEGRVVVDRMRGQCEGHNEQDEPDQHQGDTECYNPPQWCPRSESLLSLHVNAPRVSVCFFILSQGALQGGCVRSCRDWRWIAKVITWIYFSWKQESPISSYITPWKSWPAATKHKLQYI